MSSHAALVIEQAIIADLDAAARTLAELAYHVIASFDPVFRGMLLITQAVSPLDASLSVDNELFPSLVVRITDKRL